METLQRNQKEADVMEQKKLLTMYKNNKDGKTKNRRGKLYAKDIRSGLADRYTEASTDISGVTGPRVRKTKY